MTRLTPEQYILLGEDDECPRCGLGVSDCQCREGEEEEDEECNCGDFACPCGAPTRWGR